MPPQEAPPLPPYRFSRAEYDRMVDLGALEELPVELIEGVIVEASPQGTEHFDVIQVFMELLAPVATSRLRIQGPLAASEWSEPEPDVALVSRHVPGAHPATAELVVEVAVSLYRVARRKARVYAEAGIPVYWIVDVPRRRVEVHTQPGPGGYAAVEVRRGDDVLEAPTVDARISVAELFARAGLLPSET
jgi:Uma2 family endonuclease